MALPDLTGLNIQDTYQRLLQVSSSGEITDGTGSLYTPISASHAISASYAVSSSHEIIKEISSSHADIADNLSLGVNINIGHLTASGEISSSEGVVAPRLDFTSFGNTGPHLKLSSGIVTLKNPNIHLNGAITASGNISASGDIYGSDFYVSGHKALDYHPSSDSIVLGETNQPLNVQSPTTFNHVTASGNISASGEIIANKLTGIIDGGSF